MWGWEHGRSDGLNPVFPLEDLWSTLAVRLEQHDGRVNAAVLGNPDVVSAADIHVQLEWILCLDVDGASFQAMAGRDSVVGALRQAARPPTSALPEPLRSRARAIIGQQLPVRQAAVIHARMGAEHGMPINLGGAIVYGFPVPAQLAGLGPVRGLSERKVAHLRSLARATTEGWLNTVRRRAMTFDDAMSHLQVLLGIGPFSAELILLRGSGHPDAFTRRDQRLHRAMAVAYGFGDEPDLNVLEHIAEAWRPYRSWVGLLLRNANRVASDG